MNYKIIVAGWYFEDYRKLYKDLLRFKKNVIVASHKKIPSDIKKNFKCVEYENFGGVPALYQKVWSDFKNSFLSETDYLLFMHDDTIIKNIHFIEKINELLINFDCISNSQELPVLNNFMTIRNLDRYVKSDWYEKLNNNYDDFQYKIIDFRCFAIKYEILNKLNGFEDLYLGKNLRDTNISLRLFSAKYSYFFGYEKMTTLTDNWLESEYFITDKNDSLKKNKSPYNVLKTLKKLFL